MTNQSESAPVKMRRGRRQGENTTRQAIIEAARQRFSVDGYALATIRKIAADAGVNASLVIQFYGSKEGLFAAAMSMSPMALEGLATSFGGDRSCIGERVVRTFLQLWEQEAASSESMIAMLRAAVANEAVSVQLRDFLQVRLTEEIAPRLERVPDAALRAGVVATMLVGLVIGRRIVRIPALAELSIDNIVALAAPGVQVILCPS